MIRRTFFHLLSGFLLPRPDLLAAKLPKPALPPLGTMLPPAAELSDPEWLREWRRIPRLEIAPKDLPDHNDPHQRSIAADIFPCIHHGTPFTFRYLGGSEPGLVRQVLPVLLFRLDYFGYCHEHREDPADVPDPAVVPIYLLAWCLSRNAPRTFRLDRMQTDCPRQSNPCHRSRS